MLTDAQITELRAILEGLRDRIRNTSRQAAAFSRDRDKSRIGADSVDESAAEVHYGTELVLADRDNASIDKINSCLRRLEEGVLDVCEECGEAISFARLRARPMAGLCIECQEDREEEERAEKDNLD